MNEAKIAEIAEIAFRAGYAANTGCPPDCKPCTKAWERFVANVKLLVEAASK